MRRVTVMHVWQCMRRVMHARRRMCRVVHVMHVSGRACLCASVTGSRGYRALWASFHIPFASLHIPFSSAMLGSC